MFWWLPLADLHHVCLTKRFPKTSITKGQTKSKKRTKEFNFTTMRLVFVRFLEEIEDTKKAFRN